MQGYLCYEQCLGSGSVGSARFWRPGSGSGSAKICRSTDPDPRVKKNNQKLQKKTFLILRPKFELLKKREIIKISSFVNGSSSFRIEISEKKSILHSTISIQKYRHFAGMESGCGSVSEGVSACRKYNFFISFAGRVFKRFGLSSPPPIQYCSTS